MRQEEITIHENSNERMSESSFILGTSMEVLQAFGSGIGEDGISKELNTTLKNTYTALKDQYRFLMARYQAGLRPLAYSDF